MYDDLARIERIYGCVAEYNRCMEEEVECCRGYEPLYDDGITTNEEVNGINRRFEIGESYRQVGFYGGVTVYTVKEISEDRKKVLLAEHWFDYDGEGERPAEWHDVECDSTGNEMAVEWVSNEHGTFYIYA